MNYNKVIVMPAYRRPDYTKQVLEGIRRCYGSEDYFVFIFVDPSPMRDQVIDAIESVDGLDKKYFINERKLGTGDNVYQCLKYGFTLSNFVILFEDDIVPAKDCLKFLEWGRDNFKNDPNIFNITTYNRIYVSKTEYYSYEKYPWFTCWGWGTWKDRWENDLKDNWISQKIDGNWTDQVNIIRGNRVQVRPLLSRSQNIGFKNSVHELDRDIYNNYQFTPYWVDYVTDKFDKYENGYNEYKIGE